MIRTTSLVLFLAFAASPALAQRIEGTFSGENAKRNGWLELTISRNGDATCRFRQDNVRPFTARGKYNPQRSEVSLDTKTYRISLNGNELFMQNTKDPREQMVLRRRGSGGWGGGGWGSGGSGGWGGGWNDEESWGRPGDRPPSWLVGKFVGRRWDGVQFVLSVDGDGRAVAEYGKSKLDFERVAGTFRSSRLYLGRSQYTIQRRGSDIRLFLVGTKHIADLRRN